MKLNVRYNSMTLVVLFLVCQRSTIAGPPASYYDQPQFNPAPLMDDGTWVVPDYSDLVEAWGMTFIAQSPEAGAIHQGVPGPLITVTLDPGTGPLTETFVQHVADRTPPLVEVVMQANKPWSLTPLGVAMYTATVDDPLIFEPITIIAQDAVDQNLDVWVALNGEEITLYGGAGFWFTDPLAIDEPLNWLEISVTDDFGNETPFEYYFEVRSKPFFAGDVTVLGMTYQEIGDDFQVDGLLQLSSEAFDVLDVEPGTIGLYFGSEDGTSLESNAGECCSDGTEIVVTPEDGLYPGGETLLVEFSGTFEELPHSMDILGRSTWEGNEFLLLASAPVAYGLSHSGGDQPGMAMAQSGDPWKYSPYDPEEPEFEDPPETDCTVETYIKPSNGPRLHRGDYQTCMVQSTFEAVTIELQGARILHADAYAYDNCLNIDAGAKGTLGGKAKVVIMANPPRCAVGEIEVISSPSFTAMCKQNDGFSYAVARLGINVPTRDSGPSISKPIAVGGCKCVPSPQSSGTEFKIGKVGFNVPHITVGETFEEVTRHADIPLNHTYECSGGIVVIVEAGVGVGAYANRHLFAWGFADAHGRVFNAHLNTEFRWNLQECHGDKEFKGFCRID